MFIINSLRHTCKLHMFWITYCHFHDQAHTLVYILADVIGLHGDRNYFIDLLHNDVIKWKYFPRYWPFVRGIHRSPVNSPHKGQWRGALILFFDLLVFCAGNSPVTGEFTAQGPVTRGWYFVWPASEQTTKQLKSRWLETRMRSLWRHCNDDPGGWCPDDGLVQERRKSSALAMELRLSCTNPSICRTNMKDTQKE